MRPRRITPPAICALLSRDKYEGENSWTEYPDTSLQTWEGQVAHIKCQCYYHTACTAHSGTRVRSYTPSNNYSAFMANVNNKLERIYTFMEPQAGGYNSFKTHLLASDRLITI